MKNKYKKRKGILILEDGSKYESCHFGFLRSISGEVVFSTSMTGYTECITDPSYRGQILVFTYPMIGNYGVPSSCYSYSNMIHKFYESSSIQISGIIVSYYSNFPFHWNMKQSLHDFLIKNRIPGLYDIDTRSITKKLRRVGGTMLGKILVDDNKNISFYNPNIDILANHVTVKKKMIYGNGKYKILVLDFGLKNNILRCLLKRNCTIIRVPWNYNFLKESYDGLIISNGPGDPKIYVKSIFYIKTAISQNIPIFGICLGNQLLGLAAGGNTYKLTYAHRSHNQPVISMKTGMSFITSQNHSFVLNTDKLSSEWKIFFKNLNDNTCEGIIHKNKPFFSVQFHPEASSGPEDTEFLFDTFIDLVKKNIKTSHDR